jgi:chloride channel protein, CIC family
MGAALGGIESNFLPHEGAGFWQLISMGAILGGTMRAPFTAILFALELTHDMNVMLPLLVAAMLAHATTVLMLKRSILTEKVARRGFHITREYATDPLEIIFVREVMRTKVVALPSNATVAAVRSMLLREPQQRGQHLFPVVDADRRLRGVITRKHLRAVTQSSDPNAPLESREPVVAYPDEPLRMVVYRMAETGLTRMPVVDSATGELQGMVSLDDLLKARVRNLSEERHRERVLQLRFPIGNKPDAKPAESLSRMA